MTQGQPVNTSKAASREIDRVKQYIEHFVRASTDAVNRRDFSPHREPWNLYPTGRADLATEWQEGIQNVTTDEVLDMWRAYTAANPEFQCQIIGLETIVHLEDGYAECFVTGESSGDPPGVTKTAVSKMEWRFINEQWRCMSYREVQGMDGVGFS